MHTVQSAPGRRAAQGGRRPKLAAVTGPASRIAVRTGDTHCGARYDRGARTGGRGRVARVEEDWAGAPLNGGVRPVENRMADGVALAGGGGWRKVRLDCEDVGGVVGAGAGAPARESVGGWGGFEWIWRDGAWVEIVADGAVRRSARLRVSALRMDMSRLALG